MIYRPAAAPAFVDYVFPRAERDFTFVLTTASGSTLTFRAGSSNDNQHSLGLDKILSLRLVDFSLSESPYLC
jgi:hypothetical protein